MHILDFLYFLLFARKNIVAMTYDSTLVVKIKMHVIGEHIINSCEKIIGMKEKSYWYFCGANFCHGLKSALHWWSISDKYISWDNILSWKYFVFNMRFSRNLLIVTPYCSSLGRQTIKRTTSSQ